MRHFTLAAALIALLTLAAPAFAQADLDCADFGSQEEAQAVFDGDPSDPHDLDRDHDRQACEEFGYAPSDDGEPADDFAAPARAELGGGGTAEGVDPFMVFTAAAGTVLSFCCAAYVARRR